MTTEDAQKLILLLGMFGGQALLLILLSALQRENYPAPLWRFTESAWDAISRPIIWFVEGTMAALQTASEWITDRFWDLYYLTPKGKRQVTAAKAARAAKAAAFHRELHPHCRCARTDNP